MTLTSPAAVGLLRAIVEDPFDDVPRLLLADVLEEQAKSVRCQCGGTGLEQFPHANRGSGGTHPQIKCSHCQGKGYVSDGQSERAEFIRVQCELAKRWPFVSQVPSYLALRRRERELFPEAYPALAGGLPGEPVDYLVEVLSCRRRFGDRTAIFTFRRGFVASVTLTCADWCGAVCERCAGQGRLRYEDMWDDEPDCGCLNCHGTGRTGRHGPTLVLAAPIEEVVLSDRWAMQWSDGLYYLVEPGERPDLPFRCPTPDRSSPQAVLASLSRAALAWARQEAGLPALTS
jgi:uncharacterized protein (TIGR02996 family)